MNFQQRNISLFLRFREISSKFKSQMLVKKKKNILYKFSIFFIHQLILKFFKHKPKQINKI